MKFAVIGTNFISDNFADAVKRISNAEITAVYSRAAETGNSFAEKHGIPKVYNDYSLMLSSGDFDAVYVASPTLLHPEHSVKAMKSGYHVLCEKMMAPALCDFYEMKSASEKYGKVLLEAMRPTFDPSYRLLREAMGRIGRVRRATLEFCQYSSRYDRFKEGILTNAFDPKMKNSALSDIGIYPLNIAVDLFGTPSDIASASLFLHNGFEGEGSAILSYGDKLVTVIYSKIANSTNPSVIEGEDGSILIDKLTQPTKMTVVLRSGERTELSLEKNDNNMVYEIEAFIKMVKGEESHVPYLELTEKVQLSVDKIYKSTGIEARF